MCVRACVRVRIWMYGNIKSNTVWNKQIFFFASLFCFMCDGLQWLWQNKIPQFHFKLIPGSTSLSFFFSFSLFFLHSSLSFFSFSPDPSHMQCIMDESLSIMVRNPILIFIPIWFDNQRDSKCILCFINPTYTMPTYAIFCELNEKWNKTYI